MIDPYCRGSMESTCEGYMDHSTEGAYPPQSYSVCTHSLLNLSQNHKTYIFFCTVNLLFLSLLFELVILYNVFPQEAHGGVQGDDD